MIDKAEKTKRQLFIGKCMDKFGVKEVAELLQECQEPFKQIDDYYISKDVKECSACEHVKPTE